MSDNDTTSGKVLAWTEEAKYQFLLRIIAQYKEAGKSINWSRVQMAGRTTKSLQNMWTKINKQVDELEAQQGNGESATPTPKKPTPRKRAPKKVEPVDDDNEEDVEDPPKKASRKRASTGTAASRPKKLKKEESEPSPISIKDEEEEESY